MIRKRFIDTHAMHSRELRAAPIQPRWARNCRRNRVRVSNIAWMCEELRLSMLELFGLPFKPTGR